MNQLSEYFKKLSNGELDVTKTVEYRFLVALQELETPIGLNDFARNLKMTSIVSNFIDLMTKGGLISQSPYGLDLNIHDSSIEDVTSGVTGQSSSSVSTQQSSDNTTSPSTPTPPSSGSSGTSSVPPTPGSSVPPRPSVPSPSGSVPQTPLSGRKSSPVPPVRAKPTQSSSPPTPSTPGSSTSNPVPRVPTSSGPPRPGVGSVPKTPTGPPRPESSSAEDLDLPPHMQEKLNLERAKTGSRRARTAEEDEELDRIFDNMGSLEDELED